MNLWAEGAIIRKNRHRKSARISKRPLTHEVIRKIGQIQNRRVLFELDTAYKSCSVQFVIDSKDPETLIEACESAHLAGQSAVALIDALEKFEVHKLVYEYNI